MQEKVRYWVEIVEYDLETARVVLSGKRFLYVGFIMPSSDREDAQRLLRFC